MYKYLLFAALVALQVSSISCCETECPNPYVPLSGRCLFFDKSISGSWQYARSHCQSLQGDLIQLDSADLFADVVDYIHANGFTGRDYWIGGSDAGEEGHWVWPDGSKVRMGTPFWGYLSEGYPIHQEPQGGRQQNYICLYEKTAYFFHDCSANTRSPICEYRQQIL